MSLFPPYELISLAGAARLVHGAEVALVDAIAERLDADGFATRVAEFRPDLFVTITGFECFGEDMQEIEYVKTRFPDLPIAVMGHYPTLFFEEILRNTKIDYVLLGEADAAFSSLCEAMIVTKGLPPPIPGVVSRHVPFPMTRTERLPNIRDLPTPAFDLLPPGAYGEPAMAQPFGMIQAARGCPYPCNYCVRSYGQKLTLKSVEQVVQEVDELVRVRGIRALRFIDDTFTANRTWALSLCQAIGRRGYTLEWSCLTRTDAIDQELAREMQRAGCRRIYFGVESGSQRILDLYNKNIARDEALASLLACRKIGIETSAFFLLGLPGETEADFEQTVQFAHSAKLTFAAIESLTLYPGTRLFEEFRAEIDFSLFPYRNRFRDPEIAERGDRWTREFYRRFYFRPQYPLQHVRALMRSPLSMLRYAASTVQYAVLQRSSAPNPFAEIEPAKRTERHTRRM